MTSFLVRHLAEKNRQLFIRNCEISDAPRLAEEKFPAECKAEKDIEGQCLHAKKIGFVHPVTGEYLEFDSPLPDYFTRILRKLS